MLEVNSQTSKCKNLRLKSKMEFALALTLHALPELPSPPHVKD